MKKGLILVIGLISLVLIILVQMILTRSIPFYPYALSPYSPAKALTPGDYAIYNLEVEGILTTNGTYISPRRTVDGVLQWRVIERRGERILVEVTLSFNSSELNDMRALVWVDTSDNSVFSLDGERIGKTAFWIPADYNPLGTRLSEIPGKKHVKVVLVKTHRKKDFKGPVYVTEPTFDPEDYENIWIANVSEFKPGDLIGSLEVISVRKMKILEFRRKMLGPKARELERQRPITRDEYLAVIEFRDIHLRHINATLIFAFKWGSGAGFYERRTDRYDYTVIYDCERGIIIRASGVIDPLLYALGVARLDGIWYLKEASIAQSKG